MAPLYEQAHKETRTWLFDRHARLLGVDAPEMPRSLRGHKGQTYLVPVGWQGHPHVVLFLRPAFPDAPPLVFLPAGSVPATLIPHVNGSGQVCCLPPETGVNPFKPVAVLENVLGTARGILERNYSPEELRQEVVPELQAYWNPNETPCWLLRPDLVATHRLLQVQPLARPAPDGVGCLAAMGAEMEKHVTVAIVLEVPADTAVAFVHDPVGTLATMPGWQGGLALLGEFAHGHRGKRVRAGVLAGCRLPEGTVWLGGYFDQQLKLSGHRREDFAQAVQRFLTPGKFVRCDVQDIGSRRLLRRSAGERADPHEGERLAMIGCGSLGGFLLDVVARQGFGQFLLLDKENLLPANLARHVLGQPWLFRSKAEGLAEHLRERAPNTAIRFEPLDFRAPDAWQRLLEFDARLTLMATGDVNAELTLSRECARGAIGACVFTWLESNLSGGHLIFQPRGGPSLEELHEADASGRIRYRHRLLDNPDQFTLREAGCQTAFTPFAGADVALFAAVAARQILAWAKQPPVRLTVLRWTPDSGWEELG